MKNISQKGSATMLAIFVLVFVATVAAGLLPLVNAQVSLTAKNQDTLAAQYAAEAGIKRAIVGIEQSRTDWAWALNNYINPIMNGTTTTKFYVITSISPAISAGSPPVSGKPYTITSKGTVNGVSKTVTAVVTPSASSVLQNAVFSQGDMLIVSGSVTGNIASNGLITVWNGMNVNGSVFYSSSKPIINGTVIGTPTQKSSVGILDVASLMHYAPAMPAMPSFSIPPTLLPSANTALTGSYDYALNPTSGAYYYGSNFSNWNYTYTVASNQSVFIYVIGDYTIGTPITGGGNITIYATGNITVNGNIVGNNVNIYAGKNITLSQNTITGNNITLHSAGDCSVSGGSVAANANGTINIYSGGILTASNGSITGNNITLQSASDFYISGSNIIANANGTINIYSGGNFNAGSGSVTGSVVTIIAQGTPSYQGLYGTAINSGHPTYITKIYINNGNMDMSSGIIGGVSMIVVNGTINLHGTTSSAMLIASGDISAESGSSGGLYTNGSINYIHGANITYSPSALTTLGITSGNATYKVTWSN